MRRLTVLEALADRHAMVALAASRARDPESFRLLVHLGERTPGVREALEALAADPALPPGTLATLSSKTEVTRGRALFARVSLGVGTPDVARVLELARTGDAAIADVATAPIDPDVHGRVRRLILRLPLEAPSDDPLGGFFVRTLVLTAIDGALARCPDRALHDEVAEALARWVREAGLDAAGQRALPTATMLTMLKRVSSLESPRWAPALASLVDHAGRHDLARVGATAWVTARTRPTSALPPSPSPSLVPAGPIASEDLPSFDVLDTWVRGAPVTHDFEIDVLYETLGALAPGLALGDWLRTQTWPSGASRVAADVARSELEHGPAAREACASLMASHRARTERLFGVAPRIPVGNVERGDRYDDALVAALASHDTEGWCAYLDVLQTSTWSAHRALAADHLARTRDRVRDAEERVTTLALDPAREVRLSAAAVGSSRRRSVTRRTVARTLLWAAWRGDEAARAHPHVRAAREIDAPDWVRALRRTARRIGLDAEGVSFVDGALPRSAETSIRRTRSYAVTILVAGGGRVATRAHAEDGDASRLVLAEAWVIDMVRNSPTSFVRVIRAGHPDVAASVVLVGPCTGEVRPADPRLLDVLV